MNRQHLQRPVQVLLALFKVRIADRAQTKHVQQIGKEWLLQLSHAPDAPLRGPRVVFEAGERDLLRG